MINPHLVMIALCGFMVFMCGYMYLKHSLLHDFNSPEDNRAYGTWINYEFPEFLTHSYTWQNILYGSIAGALTYFFMRVGNYSYRQYYIEKHVALSEDWDHE